MLKNLVKYGRENVLGIAVAIGVVVFLIESFFFRDDEYLVMKLVFPLVGLAAYLEKRRDEKIKEKALHKKGLTLTDIQNIAFVKNWEVLRKRGLFYYCFLEGGIILGLILLMPIAVIGLFISDTHDLITHPVSILKYLGVCIGAGYAAGVLFYLVRWVNNEKRFLTLTDPLR